MEENNIYTDLRACVRTARRAIQSETYPEDIDLDLVIDMLDQAAAKVDNLEAKARNLPLPGV